eukprot:128805-Amphidinium_carterae.1
MESYSQTAKDVCRTRDAMQGVAIVVEHSNRTDFFLFVMAKLQPISLWLQPLRASPARAPIDNEIGFGPAAIYQRVSFVWTYNVAELTSEDVFTDVAPEQIKLFRDVQLLGEAVAVTWSDMVPWTDFLDVHLVETAPSESKRRKHGNEPGEGSARASSDVAKPVWFQQLHAEVTGGSFRARAGIEDEAEHHEDSETKEVDDETTLFSRINDALSNLREQMPEEKDSFKDNFVVSAQGGAWQLRRTGRMLYGIR